MTSDDAKGSEVKLLWICGLSALLSIGAYGRAATALNERAQAQAEMQAPPSRAVVSANAVVLEAPAAEFSTEINPAATNLAPYLQLHETRGGAALQVSAHANLCRG